MDQLKVLGLAVTAYQLKPTRLLASVPFASAPSIPGSAYCAGFELEEWRCDGLANHLIEWIADYALREEELLAVNHSNMYIKMQEAAVRIYTSEKYQKRGEIGEILLHAICRDFFDTIPIAPRVFYLSSSNDVVKSFDMVHIRDLGTKGFELWLGEAKFYEDRESAIKAATSSIKEHIDRGFLSREKLILGPQISEKAPRAAELRRIFSRQASLDELFNAAVFPVCIAAESSGIANNKRFDSTYHAEIQSEFSDLAALIQKSGLNQQIRVMLIYVPIGSKEKLATRFDTQLKGLAA